MVDKKKELGDLRSQRWFGRGPFSFAHRSRTLQLGYDLDEFNNRPVIAIVNTWSDMNTCHSHLRARAQAVKRGVYQAGGFPVELPAMSLGEIMTKPSTMLYRNFLAMETEELLRCHPIDAAVLMGGCDKTTPALLMGAITMNLPSIFVPAGFMLAGNWKGTKLGSGVDAWKYSAELIAGNISFDDWQDIEQGSARTAGTCNVMGTASTMTSIAEVLGFTFPGASSVPAVDALGDRLASAAGRRIVDMVWEDLKPTDILDEASFRNAVTVNIALGGSTNAAIHVLALARRAGIELDLDWFDKISRDTPMLANILPSGEHLMEDFYFAGGMRALLHVLRDRLDLTRPTVNGKTLGQNIEGAEVYNDAVIKSLDNPYKRETLAVLKGNLCPNGAVIKPSAASPHLLKHSGKALVFDSYAELHASIHDPTLDVDENTVLICRNCGPKGGPGMPEWGMLPLPMKLLQKGVRDMVRISDARMSGTSYGTCVLHVSPEAYIGGPLSLVQTGDTIELDVENRTLDVKLTERELRARREQRKDPPPRFVRGYGAMFSEHVTQAHEGCDFDYLAKPGETAEPEIHY